MSESMNFLWLRVETELLHQLRYESQLQQGVWVVWHSESGIERDRLTFEQFDEDENFPDELKSWVKKFSHSSRVVVCCTDGQNVEPRYYSLKQAIDPAYQKRTKAAIAERMNEVKRQKATKWMP